MVTTSTTFTKATGTPSMSTTTTSTERVNSEGAGMTKNGRYDVASGSGSTGVRATRQRAAVASVLESVDDFRSAQELHDLLRHRGQSVGLTTVYRTLQALAESGEVDVLRTPDREVMYRRCSSGHHHHLVCRHCGRTVEVEGPAVERWSSAVADQHGFVEVDHTLEIVGTCGGCASARR
jgi:Fur family ferric uptake transcriptional regulator